MASGNFQNSLVLIFGHEGKFSNHPDDPGGATNFGVTQKTFNFWRRYEGKPIESVRNITIFEASRLYKKQYWDAVRGDMLPIGLDHVIFDYAVNSGPVKAIKELQKALQITSDGVIGAETELNIRELSGKTDKISALIKLILKRRMSFLRRLKNWRSFGRGWTNRVRRVEQEALKMATENSSLLDPNQLSFSLQSSMR